MTKIDNLPPEVVHRAKRMFAMRYSIRTICLELGLKANIVTAIRDGRYDKDEKVVKYEKNCFTWADFPNGV